MDLRAARAGPALRSPPPCSMTYFVAASSPSPSAPASLACATPQTPRPRKTATAAGTAASVGSPASPAATAPHDSITDRADRGRIVGDATAKVWVIMVSDFQCPFCKQWHDASFQRSSCRTTSKRARSGSRSSTCRSSMHPNAMPAAEAAMCAAVQNKFWPMHEALFATQERGSRCRIRRRCSSRSRDGARRRHGRVDDLRRQASRRCRSFRPTTTARRGAGVGSTPTFFVGRSGCSRAPTVDARRRRSTSRAAIEAALQDARADRVRFPVQLGYRALGAARARRGGRRAGQRIEVSPRAPRAPRNSRALSRVGTTGPRSQPAAALDARAVGRRRTAGATRSRARATAPLRRPARLHALLAERRRLRARSRRRFSRLSAVRYARRRARRARRARADGARLLEARRLADHHARGKARAAFDSA